ncbi:MAG: hypothetical protein Q9M20_04425, partial [Mariprofundaceae bacterium]|nr:hypothetical protein [Mariprofundaceae bacterium]
LKTSPLSRSDLDEFVACYTAPSRTATWSKENPEGAWRCYDYEALIARDKASLDIFWLKDQSLEDSENLPDPDVLAQEIIEDLQTALEQIQEIALDFNLSK